MKTLLKIEVDGSGIGSSECHISNRDERNSLAICLLALMSKSEGFRKTVEAAVHCYNDRTAEVREAVEKTTLPPSALYSNNKQNS